MIAFHEIGITQHSTRLLRRFYDECLVPAFPGPDGLESLANIEECVQRNRDGTFGANHYHVLVASDDRQPVGGAIFNYLAQPNAGVIEFLVVNPSHRRTGLAIRLLERTESAMAADAQGGGQLLAWVVGELDDPFRTPASQSGMDPFVRAAVWHRWGYRMLDFPYTQPALSSEQSAVDTLVLMAKALSPDFATAVPTDAVLTLLREYLRWSMRIPQPDTDPTFQAMQNHLTGAGQSVSMISLGDYIDTKGHTAGSGQRNAQ